MKRRGDLIHGIYLLTKEKTRTMKELADILSLPEKTVLGYVNTLVIGGFVQLKDGSVSEAPLPCLFCREIGFHSPSCTKPKETSKR